MQVLSTLSLTLPDKKQYRLPCADKRTHRNRDIKKNFPDLPGIYFYVDDTQAVQYVGVCAHLDKRPLQSHSLGGIQGYWQERIAVFPFGSRYRREVLRPKNIYESDNPSVKQLHVTEELFYVEHLCIDWFRPPLNSRKSSKAKILKWENTLTHGFLRVVN